MGSAEFKSSLWISQKILVLGGFSLGRAQESLLPVLVARKTSLQVSLNKEIMVRCHSATCF